MRVGNDAVEWSFPNIPLVFKTRKWISILCVNFYYFLQIYNKKHKRNYKNSNSELNIIAAVVVRRYVAAIVPIISIEIFPDA